MPDQSKYEARKYRGKWRIWSFALNTWYNFNEYSTKAQANKAIEKLP